MYHKQTPTQNELWNVAKFKVKIPRVNYTKLVTKIAQPLSVLFFTEMPTTSGIDPDSSPFSAVGEILLGIWLQGAKHILH